MEKRPRLDYIMAITLSGQAYVPLSTEGTVP